MTVSIRPATPEDYGAFAELLPELQVDDPIPPRDRWVLELMPTTLIAEDEHVVGYLYHQCFGAVGYVRHIVTRPSGRRRGIGLALMQAARAILVEQGASEWVLNVKPDNVPARALYDALGFQLAYRSLALKLPWTALTTWVGPQTPEGSTVQVRQVEPSEDADFESSQGLLVGQLANARTLADRVILGLRLNDQPEGVLVFNPHYPGCFPFRLSDAALLPVMLSELEHHKRGEHSSVQLVIEGQPALSEALLANGAEVRLEILSLRGAL